MYRIKLRSQETLRQRIEVLREDSENPLSNVPSTEAFVLASDELRSAGGDGTAPAPYEYLLSALASCTSMTLRMYADRKGFPLKDVEIYLTHEKREIADSYVKADFIRKRITVYGDLSDEQMDRLKEIAEKCPINKLLLHSIQMESEIRRA